MGDSRHAHIFPAAVSKLRMRSRISPQRASLVGGFLLAAFAYRDLLVFEPRRAIPDPVERLLFEPADTTPALIVGLALWLLYRRRERWGRLPRGFGPPLADPSAAGGRSRRPGMGAAHGGPRPARALPARVGPRPGFAREGSRGGPRAPASGALPAVRAAAASRLRRTALIFRFQLWTAALAGQLLFALGMPARVVGESILRSDFTFSVIEGCSGLRSVVTLSMLAVLMVDLFRRHRLHAVIVVLAAPFVAFGFNAVRAVALIVNPHSSLASVHVAQGVAILLCGLLVLYALDGLLARLLPRAAAPAAPSPRAPGLARARGRGAGLPGPARRALGRDDPLGRARSGAAGSRAPLRARRWRSGPPRPSSRTASSSAACPSGRASSRATSWAARRWICSSGSAIARSDSAACCRRRPSGRAAAGSSRSGGGPGRDPATATSTCWSSAPPPAGCSCTTGWKGARDCCPRRCGACWRSTPRPGARPGIRWS